LSTVQSIEKLGPELKALVPGYGKGFEQRQIHIIHLWANDQGPVKTRPGPYLGYYTLPLIVTR
jgi:hypothetical protein